MVATDEWGIHTHGTKQLKPLLDLRPDRMDPNAVAKRVAEGPAWAIVDGCYAIAPATSCYAMQVAIEKAKQAGVSYVGVRNSNHFGAAAYYANMAVREDMIGLSMSNTNPLVTVPGGRLPVLGTNPFCYAVPAGEEKPAFLDMATSVVAASKPITARALGKKIPGDWLVDEHGIPTTDPSRYPDVGALLPMAGHKGYGLALMIEILTAVITGAQVLDEVKLWLEKHPGPLSQGHAFIAIDIAKIMSLDRFKARMDAVIREIRNAPKGQGHDRIYLPGEMEWERHERNVKEGMLLPEDVFQRLSALAGDFEMDLGALVRRRGYHS